jgi:hypothetical protein
MRRESGNWTKIDLARVGVTILLGLSSQTLLPTDDARMLEHS